MNGPPPPAQSDRLSRTAIAWEGDTRPPVVAGWRDDELETVPRCPACTSPRRQLLYQGMDDVTFGTQGSGWRMWSCLSCASGYLDPRPAAHAIHKAYAAYYTHLPSDAVGITRNGKGLLRPWVDGFKHARFGSQAHRPHCFGAQAIEWIRPLRLKYERDYRNLPRPGPGLRRLLDLGCGDGAFLAKARDCGWRVCGIEPDPVAAERAASLGLRIICGDIDSMAQAGPPWDVITMSHVIEHVPDPRRCLLQCLQALEPGGIIWIETPNIASQGHRHFGAHWRGLEVPRHLTLFNSVSLRKLLEDAGFAEVRELPRPSAIRPLFKDSLRIREHLSPDRPRRLRWTERLRVWQLDIGQWWDPTSKEVLTFSARRPAA